MEHCLPVEILGGFSPPFGNSSNFQNKSQFSLVEDEPGLRMLKLPPQLYREPSVIFWSLDYDRGA